MLWLNPAVAVMLPNLTQKDHTTDANSFVAQKQLRPYQDTPIAGADDFLQEGGVHTCEQVVCICLHNEAVCAGAHGFAHHISRRL